MRHLPTWLCDFDIDRYLTPIVPPSPVPKFPAPIAHFLGHRTKPRAHLCQPAQWFWSFTGAFCSIALISGVSRASPALQTWNPPIIIGSFGAAAILEFNAIESPLSQPRHLIFSHAISSAIGVGVTKLFALLPPACFDDLRWLAGALAVAASSVAMSITKTVHPPAGATALLAATTPDISALGWRLVPLVLVGAALMLGCALLVNNIQRQFPVFWFTPVDVRREAAEGKDTGDGGEKATSSSIAKVRTQQGSGGRATAQGGFAALDRKRQNSGREREIRIVAKEVFVPDWLEVSSWEQQVLEMLRTRLAEEGESSGEDSSVANSGSRGEDV